MPPIRYMPLVPVPPDGLRRIAGLPTARQLKTTFPKRAVASAVDARAALRRWQESVPDPAPVRNPDVPIKALALTRARLNSLRAVADSDVAPAELLHQEMSVEGLFGTLYSSLTTFEFMKLQAEYKRRKAGATAASRTEAQWREVVRAATTAYAAAGLSNVKETELSGFVRELTANRANLDTVTRLANSAVAVGTTAGLTSSTKLVASFIPVVGRVIDTSVLATAIADLCSEPISQGSFTKHFSRSISLSVSIKYWCPTWSNPWRTCTKTVTLAGVSFSIGVNVGYKITCCGATAWGQAHAEVCATILTIRVCASCTATITGVAGVSRTPVSSGCTYGLGINANLKCTFAGQTILNLSYPFGWTVTGPCPPAGLCP